MSGAFINPPPSARKGDFSNNPAYAQGSILDIQWSTSYDPYYVYLYQQDPTADLHYQSAPIYVKQSGSNETGGFSWTIDPLTFQTSFSNIFFLAVLPNNKLTQSFLSHYFNITTTAASPSNDSPSSTASSLIPSVTSPLPSSTQHSLPSPTSSGSPVSLQNDHSTNQMGLELGLALGLGIPIILLLAFLAFQLSRRRRSRTPSSPGGLEVSGTRGSPTSKYHKLIYPKHRSELDSPESFVKNEYQSQQHLFTKPVELDSSQNQI